MKDLIRRDRGPTHLPGYHLNILSLDGVDHIQRRQTVILEFLGVEPDPHTVRTGAFDDDLTDARDPGERIFQVDDGVIGKKGGVVTIVF